MKSIINITLAVVVGITAVGAFSKTNKPTGTLRIGDLNGTNDWKQQVDWHNQGRWHPMGDTNYVWFTIRGMPPQNTNLENVVIFSSYEPVVTRTNLGQWEIRFRKVGE